MFFPRRSRLAEPPACCLKPPGPPFAHPLPSRLMCNLRRFRLYASSLITFVFVSEDATIVRLCLRRLAAPGAIENHFLSASRPISPWISPFAGGRLIFKTQPCPAEAQLFCTGGGAHHTAARLEMTGSLGVSFFPRRVNVHGCALIRREPSDCSS